MPLLFDNGPHATQVARLDKLFLTSIYWDQTFMNDLKVEIDGYNLSLVSQPFATSVIAGAKWIGVLLKMIQSLKKLSVLARSDQGAVSIGGLQSQPSSQNDEADGDVKMDGENVRVQQDWPLLPLSPVQPFPPPLSKSPVYDDGNSAKTRQAWHYAVLFKASTHPFPGTLTLKKGSDMVVTSEDVAKYFPLEDRLLIGKDEYFAKSFNPLTLQLQLGKQDSVLKTVWCDNIGLSAD